MKLEFIFMAAVSALLGIIITFIVIWVCGMLDFDMGENLWVIVIPVILAISLNILFIELYRKYMKK
jgi:xanthine/uracil permease